MRIALVGERWSQNNVSCQPYEGYLKTWDLRKITWNCDQCRKFFVSKHWVESRPAQTSRPAGGRRDHSRLTLFFLRSNWTTLRYMIRSGGISLDVPAAVTQEYHSQINSSCRLCESEIKMWVGLKKRLTSMRGWLMNTWLSTSNWGYGQDLVILGYAFRVEWSQPATESGGRSMNPERFWKRAPGKPGGSSATAKIDTFIVWMERT